MDDGRHSFRSVMSAAREAPRGLRSDARRGGRVGISDGRHRPIIHGPIVQLLSDQWPAIQMAICWHQLVGSATPRVFVIAVMHASYMAWLLGWAAIMPVRLMWACAHSFI